MALVTFGTGGTIQPPATGDPLLEQFIYSLIKFGQSSERSVATNPSSLNYLTSSETDDGADPTLNASIAFPASIANSDNDRLIVIPDYLSLATYTSGTGGSYGADNWCQDLVNAIFDAKKLELGTNTSNISWTLQNGQEIGATTNATFTATLNLPLIKTLTPDGELTKAKEYLPRV